jgi:hypothetical protein
VAAKVAAADVSDGTVAWLTGDGRVGTQRVDGTEQRTFAIPFAGGCGQTNEAFVDDAHLFSVTNGLVALSERCGTGKNALDNGLVLDTSGRVVLRITGMTVVDPSIDATDLTFAGLTPDRPRGQTYHIDLTTDVLSTLGAGADKAISQPAITAGRYVLWYDAKGGHVGEFTG